MNTVDKSTLYALVEETATNGGVGVSKSNLYALVEETSTGGGIGVSKSTAYALLKDPEVAPEDRQYVYGATSYVLMSGYTDHLAVNAHTTYALSTPMVNSYQEATNYLYYPQPDWRSEVFIPGYTTSPGENWDFETGDLTGWTLEGTLSSGDAVTAIDDLTYAFEGSHFIYRGGQAGNLDFIQTIDVSDRKLAMMTGQSVLDISWAINAHSDNYTESADVYILVEGKDSNGNVVMKLDSRGFAPTGFESTWRVNSERFRINRVCSTIDIIVRLNRVAAWHTACADAIDVKYKELTNLDDPEGVILPINGSFSDGDTTGWDASIFEIKTDKSYGHYNSRLTTNAGHSELFYHQKLIVQGITAKDIDSGNLVLDLDWRYRHGYQHSESGVFVSFIDGDGNYITDRLGEKKIGTSGYDPRGYNVKRIPKGARSVRIGVAIDEFRAGSEATVRVMNINAKVRRILKGTKSSYHRWYCQSRSDAPYVVLDDYIEFQTGDSIEFWCSQLYENWSSTYVFDGPEDDIYRPYVLTNTSRRLYFRPSNVDIYINNERVVDDQRQMMHYDNRPYLYKIVFNAPSRIKQFGGRFNWDSGDSATPSLCMWDVVMKRAGHDDRIYRMDEPENAKYFLDSGPGKHHIRKQFAAHYDYMIEDKIVDYRHHEKMQHSALLPPVDGAEIPMVELQEPTPPMRGHFFRKESDVFDMVGGLYLQPGATIKIFGIFYSHSTTHIMGSTTDGEYLALNAIRRDGYKIETHENLYVNDQICEPGVHSGVKTGYAQGEWMVWEINNKRVLNRIFGREDGQYQDAAVIFSIEIDDPILGRALYKFDQIYNGYVDIPDTLGNYPAGRLHNAAPHKSRVGPPVFKQPLPRLSEIDEQYYKYPIPLINGAGELGTGHLALIPYDGSHGWKPKMGRPCYTNYTGSYVNSYHFGSSSGDGACYQDVLLADHGVTDTMVDQDDMTVQLTYRKKSYAVANDPSFASVATLDSNGDETASSRHEPEANRYNVWCLERYYVKIPVGTRSVRVSMAFRNQDSSNGDGYIDDIQVTLLKKKWD